MKLIGIEYNQFFCFNHFLQNVKRHVTKRAKSIVKIISKCKNQLKVEMEEYIGISIMLIYR